MSRKGENIYKRKDGRWEGRYIRERIDGKARYRSVYAKTYRDVRQKMAQAKRELAEALSGIQKESTEELCGKWMNELEGILKKSSLEKYESLLRCYILPGFRDKKLSEITDAELSDFVSGLLKNGGTCGRGLSISTVSEILSVMNGLRDYAMKQKYAVAYSTKSVKLKNRQKEIRTFSLSEEQKLIKHLYANMDYTALGILLCLFTGIRLGELCALHWDDLNLTDKTMRIDKTMQRLRVTEDGICRTKVQILNPKSASSARIIPLPEQMIQPLADYYKRGTFFLTGDKEYFIEPRTMQYRFKRILSDCRIREANFHATRHTFATRSIELGFDVKSLSEILGHSTVSVTMNRYVHPSMELKAEHMNRLSDLFAVKKMVTGTENTGITKG